MAIFSVMNGENKEFTDVRYSAHGSPWYPATMLDGIVSLDKDKVLYLVLFFFLCACFSVTLTCYQLHVVLYILFFFFFLSLKKTKKFVCEDYNVVFFFSLL